MAIKKKRIAEPIDIYGNWTVTSVELEPGTRSIGIKVGSKFRIAHDTDLPYLEKTKNVRWDGDVPDFWLESCDDGDVDVKAQGYLLRACVTLAGKHHTVKFGTDDGGATMKIQVDSVDEPKAQPGGSASAGRGGT